MTVKTANIESITLEEPPNSYNNIKLVKINFKFPCTWTVLHIEDLKIILEKWIEGEEEKYPQSKGFKGRWLLFEEIKKVFDNYEVEKSNVAV